VTDKRIGSNSNAARYVVSYEDINSGDFTSSEHKRNYATNLDIGIENRLRNKSEGKQSEAVTQFKPENYIDPLLLEIKSIIFTIQSMIGELNRSQIGLIKLALETASRILRKTTFREIHCWSSTMKT